MLNNWLEGKQLSNFRVDEFLGRGGMAQVYKGWDITLERPVAIKVIAAIYQDDPEYTARFLQEGRAMARWRHENIVHIYFAGQEEDINYLVMEYVEGSDLKQWLSQYQENNQKVAPDEVLRIGRAIAEALDYAHEHGIVHRDVKPSNILMAEDGRILLTDFGLALDLQEGSSGQAFGSPKYISPEQAQSSEDVVSQSDLYSLGIILYEMLTGSTPFEGGSPTAMAVQHINQAPPLPSVLNPDLNKETERVLLKSLSKSPNNRYQYGRALMAALEKALNSGGGPVGPRTFSTKPVTDVVAAHIATSAPARIENPDDTFSGPPAPAANRRQIGKLLPFLGFGAALIFICLAGFLLASFIVDRIGQGEGKVLDVADGTQVVTPTDGEGGLEASNGDNNPESNEEEAPAPTVTLPPSGGAETSENRLVFFYNAGGFYAWNPGSRDITVAHLSFQEIDGSGNPTGAFFEARRWAGYFPAIQSGFCDRLEILNDVPRERPTQCNHYNAIMTPEENDPMIFWLAGDNTSQFIVSFGGEEIGRCDIAAGQCEVVLP
jgi:predicted Ser/Thr protein kinase